MGNSYYIIDRKDSKKLTEYLIKNGQLLMPLVQLIDIIGHASIEAVLKFSAITVV